VKGDFVERYYKDLAVKRHKVSTLVWMCKHNLNIPLHPPSSRPSSSFFPFLSTTLLQFHLSFCFTQRLLIQEQVFDSWGDDPNRPPPWEQDEARREEKFRQRQKAEREIKRAEKVEVERKRSVARYAMADMMEQKLKDAEAEGVKVTRHKESQSERNERATRQAWEARM
jgi:hypothetical protein